MSKSGNLHDTPQGPSAGPSLLILRDTTRNRESYTEGKGPIYLDCLRKRGACPGVIVAVQLLVCPLDQIQRCSPSIGRDRPVPTEQIRVQQIRLRADSWSPRQCRCGGLQDHYRRHSVRVGHAQEADLERSLLDPSTRLGSRCRANQPT